METAKNHFKRISRNSICGSSHCTLTPTPNQVSGNVLPKKSSKTTNRNNIAYFHLATTEKETMVAVHARETHYVSWAGVRQTFSGWPKLWEIRIEFKCRMRSLPAIVSVCVYAFDWWMHAAANKNCFDSCRSCGTCAASFSARIAWNVIIYQSHWMVPQKQQSDGLLFFQLNEVRAGGDDGVRRARIE